MRNYFTLTLGCLLGASIAASAHAVELSSFVSDAQKVLLTNNSLSLQSAQVTYDRAARELGVDLLDETRINASANSTAYLADDTTQENSLVATVDLTQPLTSQLSLGAKLTSENETTLSVTYQPFAEEWITPQQTYNYEQAKVRLDYAKESIVDTFQVNLSDLFTAQLDYQLAGSKLQLAQLTEESIQAAATVDDVSTDDLIEAQRETLSAQKELLSAKMTLSESQLLVSQALGVPTSDIVAPTLTQLQALVENRKTVLSARASTNIASENTMLLEAELNYLQSTAENIDGFDSGLTFSSSYEIEDQVFKAGVSFNLSPSSWNDEKKLDSALDVSIQEMQIKQEAETLALQVQLQQQRVELEAESAEVSNIGYQQQQQVLQETQYLFELGERTQLELTEQELIEIEAGQTYMKALYDVINAQQVLSRYFSS
jgi:outer membrane protein TolC